MAQIKLGIIARYCFLTSKVTKNVLRSDKLITILLKTINNVRLHYHSLVQMDLFILT